MTAFLRWGIFGILGVAALLYAYNASKRLAEAHAAKAVPATSSSAAEPVEMEAPESDPQPEPARAPEVQAAPVRELTAECEAELFVAQRAIDMRKDGAPLDRVLRIREIAWQESPERRVRLEDVATRWYNYSGEFSPDMLRMAVANACKHVTPAS